MDNRPTIRESNVSSDHGYSVDRRGDGLNLGGPLGNSNATIIKVLLCIPVLMVVSFDRNEVVFYVLSKLWL